MLNWQIMLSSDDETLSINLNSNCLHKAKCAFPPSPILESENSSSKNISNRNFLNTLKLTEKNYNNEFKDLFDFPNFADLEKDLAFNLRNRHCKLEQQLGILEEKVIRLMDDVNIQLDTDQVSQRFSPKANHNENILCKENHKFLVLLIHRLLKELRTTKHQYQQVIDKINIRYEKLRRTVKWLQSVPNDPPYLERTGAGDQCLDLMH